MAITKQEFRTIKILEEDYRKLKRWSANRDMKMYEVVRDLFKIKSK